MLKIETLLSEREAQLQNPIDAASANRRFVNALVHLSSPDLSPRIEWHAHTSDLFAKGLAAHLLYTGTYEGWTLHFVMNCFAGVAGIVNALTDIDSIGNCTWNFTLSLSKGGEQVAFGNGVLGYDPNEAENDEDGFVHEILSNPSFVLPEHFTALLEAISVQTDDHLQHDVVTDVRRYELACEYLETGHDPFNNDYGVASMHQANPEQPAKEPNWSDWVNHEGY